MVNIELTCNMCGRTEIIDLPDDSSEVRTGFHKLKTYTLCDKCYVEGNE